MGSSTSKILIYASATAEEEQNLVRQMQRLGYTAIERLKSHLHLQQSSAGAACLLLLLTDTESNWGNLLEVLHHAGKLPVIGLFSPQSPLYLRPVIDACQEVETYPCDERMLDFRLSRILLENDESPDARDRLLLKANMVGNSPEFCQVINNLIKIAACDAPVYIEGETGTGKELIARSIHYSGSRRDGPFVAANCGALPDQLVENELYGHEKGAYTDASQASEGLVAQAQGGTLFLDEIETLPGRGQVVLLRFLEDMSYRPLGAKSQKSADLRIITATNESIERLVEEGSFRKDLYYRINIMNLSLPPLRERRGDIALLAEHFVRCFQSRYQQPERELHPETLDALKYHDWPGNVRELENMLHREFLLTEGHYIVLPDIEALQRERRAGSGDRRLQELMVQPMMDAKQKLVCDFERQYLSNALHRAGGNISEAARLAGKERRSFTRLLEKHGIERG